MKLLIIPIFFRFYFLSMYIWFYSCLILQFMYLHIVMSMYSYCMFMYLHRASWHSSATLTEVFPCFFFSCKANARVKPAKMAHSQHSCKLLCCSTYCLLCVILCNVCVVMCTVLLPQGGYPTAVNKYIIS